MVASEDLIGAVCAHLTSLAEHVASLSPSDHTVASPELGGSSIGQHVRHCLDHFLTLRAGLACGRFDYDERVRDTEVERDPVVAAELARRLAATLRAELDPVDIARRVLVRTASSPDGEVAWQVSSIGRELQFVVSHTVHHSAMIAASCRARGLHVAVGHGVAPSTLRHRSESAHAAAQDAPGGAAAASG